MCSLLLSFGESMNYSQHESTLYVVTKPSLQAKALVNLLSSSLPVTALLHNVLHPLISPPENALILYDRTETNAKCDLRWQHSLRKINTPFKLLLIYRDFNEQSEHIFDWPSVRGLFCMADDYHHLIDGIKKVLQNECYLSDDLNERYQGHTTLSHACALITEREKAVLLALRDGASNVQIADALFISQHTVKAHLYNIFKKIEVKNRTLAVLWVNKNIRFFK